MQKTLSLRSLTETIRCRLTENLGLEIWNSGSSVCVSVLRRGDSGFSPVASMEVRQDDHIIMRSCSDVLAVLDGSQVESGPSASADALLASLLEAPGVLDS